MLTEQQKKLHKHYSYNCLSEEDFEKFVSRNLLGSEFNVDCDECGKFFAPVDDWDSHRCGCDNRRCYIQVSEGYREEDGISFYADVD